MKARTGIVLAAAAAAAAIIVTLLNARSTDVELSTAGVQDRSREVEEPVQQVRQREPGSQEATAAIEAGDNASRRRESFDCELSDFDSSGPLFANLQELNEFNRSVSAALSASQDAEHLLSAALFGKDGKFGVDAIREAVERNPEDSRYRWHLLQACLSDHYEGDCDVEAVQDDAVRMAGRSAHVWSAIAAGHARNGDIGEAADALRRAIGAPEYRNYRAEDILMLERSLSVASDLGFIDRIGHAFAAVDRVGSIGADLYETCQHRVYESGELTTYCLQMAEKIESSNTTLIDSTLALLIQKLAYEHAGSFDKAARAQEQLDRISDRQRSNRENELIVLQTDPKVLADYVAELSASGEIAAMDFATRETERLLADPDYDPCALIPEQAVPATPDQ